ncbi:MAG: class I SAM-dependent methyltransferase [Planctomycetota bacterium]
MLDNLRFYAGMRRDFKTVGAVAPSSGQLARSMLKRLGPLQPGQVIVELGPGTGAITKRIRRLYPEHPLLAVEFDELFARRLQNRFPGARICAGCASRLPEHLERHGFQPEDVGGVISGLPLLNFPLELRSRIFDGIADSLPSGRRYVQFTYSKRAWRHIHPQRFQSEPSRRIFFNVPPAVVLPFIRS